jgi:hypothetical protein
MLDVGALKRKRLSPAKLHLCYFSCYKGARDLLRISGSCRNLLTDSCSLILWNFLSGYRLLSHSFNIFNLQSKLTQVTHRSLRRCAKVLAKTLFLQRKVDSCDGCGDLKRESQEAAHRRCFLTVEGVQSRQAVSLGISPV